MSNCEHVGELLGSWLDGELSRSAAEEVRSHVTACAACREQVRQLEKLDLLLKSALAAAPATAGFPVFWRGVKQRLEMPRPWGVRLGETLRSVFAGPALAWTVPAVIVLLIGLFSLDAFWPPWRARPQNNFAAVESIDAHGRNVALLREDHTKTTVIWLYQEEDDDPAEEPAASPTF